MSELLERYDDIVKRALRTGRLENILFARIIRRKIKMKHNINLETVNRFEQYKNALKAYYLALQDLNCADHEHLDMAIIRFEFAKKKLNLIKKSLETEKELPEAPVEKQNNLWLNFTELSRKLQDKLKKIKEEVPNE
jgi:hypothetical protein